MNLEGFYLKEISGILYLYDNATNQPVYYFETPYMYDSYKPEGFQSVEEVKSVPEEAISYEVKLDYEMINNQLFLHLIPNKEWLEDPNRIFPITIDPTIVRLQSTPYVEDTSIRSSFPTQTGGNDLELGAGASNANIIRSLIKFDLISIPEDSTILSSSLNLWFSSTNNSSPIDVSLYKVTKDWEENQASWTYAKTSPAVLWTNQGGDYITSNKFATVSGITSPTTLDQDIKKWEIPINIVQEWKNYPNINYGILLKSDSESTNIYKKFVSSEQSIDAKYKPLLVVTYRTNARLGLEDYWVYDSHSLVGGTSYSNLTTNNNVVQYTDFSLPGRGGFGLNFTRTYNSKSKESSVMGYGWTFTGNEKLFLNIKGTANILDYQDSDGTDHEFTYDGPTATYYSGPGKYLTIKKSTTDSTLYTMEDKYGVKTTFKILKTNNDTSVQVANIQSKEDRHGNRITYSYDATNNFRIMSIASDLRNGDFRTITFQYDPMDGYVQSVLYGGSTFTFDIEDATGFVKSVDQLKDSTSTRTSFTYTNGQISRITDPNGRKIDYTYQNGYLTKVQDPQIINGETDPDNRPGITYNIDTVNKIATVTQPEGTVTTYYTNDNYVATKINEDGVETTFVRDSNYNPELIIKNGIQTSNSYDLNGNLLSTTDPEEHTTTFTYTTYSNMATLEDSNHNVTRYTYNGKGDLDTILYPDNSTDKFVFDAYGDLDKVIYPDGTIEDVDMNYSTGQTTQTKTDELTNTTTKTVTDSNGNVIEKEDSKFKKYKFEYNKKNELETVTDPMQQQMKYAYDSNGNLKSITNAKGKATTFEYDGQNQLTKEIDSLHQSDQKGVTYQYDGNGNLTEATLLNGHSIVNQYDYANNQLTSIGVKNSPTDPVTTEWGFAYDNYGRIFKVCKATPCNTAQKVFVYNDDDSVANVTDRGNSIDYTDLGSQQKVKYTVGSHIATLDYFLNNMNQLQEIKRTKDNTTTTLATFGYKDGGLPISVTYNNGSYIQMEYNKNHLDKYKVYDKTPDEYTFVYDGNQNITKITSNAGTTDFAYDELNQLTQEKLPDGTIIDYSYDAVGNRTSKKTSKSGVTLSDKTNIFNDLNQLVEIKENNQIIASFSYDLNGNLSSDGSKTYVFNDFNQLIEIKENSQTIASFTYDEEGKRNSSYTPSSGTINYFYDGDKVLYETDSNNNVLREYTYTEDGIPLTMTMNGNMYYYLYNHHGDILGLTDSQGNVVASYTYDAWGNILTQTGPMASMNPYRYAGYRYDDNTGLYYLMARYYNPNTGVFLSIDPVRGNLMDPITQNGYNYANNNPVMNMDPTGMYSIYGFEWNKKKYIAWALNIALIAYGGALGKATKTIGQAIATKKAKNELLGNLNRVLTKEIGKLVAKEKVAKITTKILTHVNTLFTLVNLSIGDGLAYVIDKYVDPMFGWRRAGYCFE